MILAKEVPPITELFEWPALLFPDTSVALTKYGLGALIAAAISAVVWIAGSNGVAKSKVPRGFANAIEALYNFIRNSIVVDIMGSEGLKYVPFLGTLFTFLLFSNLFEVIPGWQLPVTSTLGVPIVLALTVWIVFTVQGIASQGLGHYLGGHLFPPGVPKPIYVLLTPIELLQITVLRPFTLAVRVFANMVAGHVLLTIFIVFCESFFWPPGARTLVFLPSFLALVLMTGFEIFVAFIQAFIFTMLTAVYIGESIHGH
jgi:F-type H+-transporting ATPase subunit a